MKTKLLAVLAAFVMVNPLLRASEIVGGPNGGRLLETDNQKLEFFVTETRLAKVVFLSTDLATIDPGTASVELTAQLPYGREKINLVRDDSGFVSESPLPEGEPYRIVVQVRSKPEARPKNFRIDLNLAHCGGCDRGEYACTCNH